MAIRVRTGAGIAVLAALVLVAGCNRNKLKLTECIGDKPAVERIHDAAPPNCPSS